MSENEQLIVILMIFGIVLLICVFILCLSAVCNSIGNTESGDNEIEIYDKIINKILTRNEKKTPLYKMDDNMVEI